MSYRIDTYQILPNTSAWAQCDKICYFAKNLYNSANYIIRQEFLKQNGHGAYLNYYAMDKIMQPTTQYKALPANASQHVLTKLHQNWLSFFASIKAYNKDKTKFSSKPKPPKYKDVNGRFGVDFSIPAVSKRMLKKDKLKLVGFDFSIDLRKFNNGGEYTCDKNIKEVSVVPKNDSYIIIVKYLYVGKTIINSSEFCAGIDLGVNNIAAISTNNPQLPSILINGKPIKNINQFYNKQKSKLQSQYDTTNSNREKKRLKKEIQKLTRNRNNKIKHELHQISSMIVNQLSFSKIYTIVIGRNIGWKQETKIGTKNTQNFQYIPHCKFIEMLKYKWERIGGVFKTTEESYTSKCSFLDMETVEFHNTYKGTRIKRGLFVTKNGYKINADVNGAANILRKVVKNAWILWSEDDLIKGFVVNPVRLTANQPNNLGCKCRNLKTK